MVVDSSVLVAALVDSGPAGQWAERVVAAGDLAAPELIMAEVANVLRRLELDGTLSRAAADAAWSDLLALDLHLLPFAALADRIWELRHNVTAYDAWYVALAEALNQPLATLDARLARASGPRCEFVLPE